MIQEFGAAVANPLVLTFLLVGSPPPPTTPAGVVKDLYAIVVRHHPLGLPTGEVKQAMQPLLSARLAATLEALQSCEDDYYRRYRKVLEAKQLKPNLAWLEYGVFSGGNEEALPAEVEVAEPVALPDGRFRVNVTFTYRETPETHGRPPDEKNTFRWKGTVMVASETGGYRVDDFIPLDSRSGRPLAPLSRAFAQCKGGKWVGDTPY